MLSVWCYILIKKQNVCFVWFPLHFVMKPRILCYGPLKPVENVVMLLYLLLMPSLHFEVKYAGILNVSALLRDNLCSCIEKRIEFRLKRSFFFIKRVHFIQSRNMPFIYILHHRHIFHGETLNVFIVKLINLTLLIRFCGECAPLLVAWCLAILLMYGSNGRIIDQFNHPWDTHEARLHHTMPR